MTTDSDLQRGDWVMLAQELWNWLLALEPDFAFLLGLPFMVAAAGLLRYEVDRWNLRRSGTHGH